MWLNHHNLNRVCAGLAIIVVTGTGHAGSILYVDDDAPAAGDGTSWNTAFRFLADALAVADDPKSIVSEIRVGQGTYLPDRDETQPDGSGDREARFRLNNSVALMGGYAGLGAPDPDARDIALYETILSGDLLGNDGPNFTNNDENSYHVVVIYGDNNENVTLDGFTITRGNATSIQYPSITSGGGMINYWNHATILNCTFKLNAAFFGGGMFNQISNPIVINCTFTRNRATEPIPGQLNYGGGMANFASSPKVINCVFNGNYVDRWGAAISNIIGSSPEITNCLFSGNLANEDTGGILNFDDSNPTISNCTFASNESFLVGAIHNKPGCFSSMFNCIIWDNQGIAGQIVGDPANVAYSCVQDGYDGISNIDADPMFVRNPDPGPDMVWGTEDDDYGDLRLMPGSPCIDAGNNWGIPIDADDFDQDSNIAELFPVDLAGSPRFNADEADFDPGCGNPVVIDMGVYEYQYDPVKQIIFADIDGDGAVRISDLIALLESWGDSSSNCLADLDINGNVGTVDLLALFANWGSGG